MGLAGKPSLDILRWPIMPPKCGGGAEAEAWWWMMLLLFPGVETILVWKLLLSDSASGLSATKCSGGLFKEALPLYVVDEERKKW